MENLSATAADIEKLVSSDAVTQLRLQIIVLSRLLDEARQEIAALKASK